MALEYEKLTIMTNSKTEKIFFLTILQCAI